MRLLNAFCLCLLAHFLAACGDHDPSSGPEKPPKSGENNSAATGKFEIGDGIGTHGVSLETFAVENAKRMIADGADPEKPHLIEHHLAAGTPETARAIVQWGTDNGFTPTGFDEAKVVAGEWILIDLVKPTKLDPQQLWQDSSRIASLAESLDCEYENWGCTIVK